MRVDAIAIRAVLARTPALNAEHLRALRAVSGLEGALEPSTIEQVNLAVAARTYLTSPDTAALRADLRWIQDSGAHLTLAASSAATPLLAGIPPPPTVLFVLGDVDILRERQVAM